MLQGRRHQVQLYRSGAKVGSAVSATDGATGYDFTALIGDVSGYYTAKVRAVVMTIFCWIALFRCIGHLHQDRAIGSGHQSEPFRQGSAHLG